MKNSNIITQMTLKEQCAFLSGATQFTSKAFPKLGIPALCFSDGPLGVRKQYGTTDHLGLNPSQPATCYPAPATLANTWDLVLEEEVGRHLGMEAAALGVDVLLGPGLNTKRSPLCGRNFEYFSEDPYLSGKLAAACIRGIQSAGVAACPKHFAANSQETLRMHSDSVMDERTLREIYLTGFEIAVKEGHPKWIMSAYNRINGIYANEDYRLLREILVDEWGFDGCVVTDWGGSNDHVAGVAAGSHLEMPAAGPSTDRELLEAVQSGHMDKAWVAKMAAELFHTLPETPAIERLAPYIDWDAHHAFARRVAAESAVLLKNEEGLLPLTSGTRVAVIGDFAGKARFQGGGSSCVNPTRVDCSLDCLKENGLEVVGYAPGFCRNGDESVELLDEAVSLAENADVALVWLGLDERAETEGMDRENLSLPENQIKLLEAVAAVNLNVVVVLICGAPVELPWVDQCKALLLGGLGGQASGGGVADVLTGRVNPSGKLTESWPLHLEDTPCAPWYPGRESTAEYREGPFVGYRYYETVQVPIRFHFGFGLSYTNFCYQGLEITNQQVSFTLTNIGPIAGEEIAQLYIAKLDSRLFRPVRELKGFVKIPLEVGESHRVSIPLDEYTFRYFNIKTNQWELEGGTYQVMVGASCTDIRLIGFISIDGTGAPIPYALSELPHYFMGQVHEVSNQEFTILLGRSIPPSKWDRTAPLMENDTFSQLCYAKGQTGRLVYQIIRYQAQKAVESDKPNLDALFRMGMPFRAMAKMTAGMVDMNMVRALLVIFNGHFWRGAVRLLKAWWKKHRLNQKGGMTL